MKCPSCGAPVPVDDLDCTQCGASVGWWVRTREGEESGPYTFLTVQEMIRQGKLRPLDRVRIGLIGEWVSAPEVLRPTFQRPPAAEPAPPRRSGERSRRSRAVLIVGGGVLLLAACAIVVATRASIEPRPTGGDGTCRRNLSELARALTLYAQDWDGVLPPWQMWGAAALGSVEDPGVFVCPGAPTEPGYAYNAGLSSVWTAAVSRPDRCALLWDAGALGPFPGLSSQGLAPRHLGGDNWAFVDGHARWQLRGPYPPRDIDFQP